MQKSFIPVIDDYTIRSEQYLSYDFITQYSCNKSFLFSETRKAFLFSIYIIIDHF
jgi:hypothetical protein